MKFSKNLLLFLALGFIATASSIFFQDVSNSSTQLGQAAGSSIAVRDLILVNADTNQDIGVLTNGFTLNVSSFGTENYSVRAETQPEQVGSVRFSLNGNENYQTENIAPYTLAGDSQNGQNYNPVVFEEGQNTIKATPFTKRNGGGQAGAIKNISFNVVYGGQEGAPRGPDGDGVESIVGNGIQVTSPDPSASYVPGQDGIPLTCDIGTDPGFHVYKLLFTSYQVIGGQTSVYTFAEHENVEYTTGEYTEYVTLPQEVQPGNFFFHCVAYFYDGNTNSYSTPGLTPAQDNLGVQVGGHSEPAGETNTISITSPSANSNVVVGQPFALSVSGSPTNDEIQSVEFYLNPGFGGLNVDPVSLGSDSTSPFSIQATVSERFYRCPQIYAIANLNDGTQIKTTSLHPVAITDSPTNNPWQCTPTTISPNDYSFRITEPAWQTSTDPGIETGESFEITAIAGNLPQNVSIDYVEFFTGDTNTIFDPNDGEPDGFEWNFNLVSTDTNSPYSTQASFSQVGNYGHPFFTNQVRAHAYFSDGSFFPSYIPVKVVQSQTTASPQITSLELVTASGQVIETLEGGEVINTGIGGYGPNITIRANANADTESVRFNLQKPVGVHTMIENSTPYAMFGDSNGTYALWQDLQTGPHTLTVTPYELDAQGGIVGQPVIIQFSLENNDDIIAPSAPANAEIEYRSSGTARVSWDASTDNVGVTGYQVYRNGNAEGFPTGNLYRDISPGSQGDSITVRATDAAGNWSDDSNVANIPPLSTQFTNGQSVYVQNGQTATVYSAPPSSTSNGNQVASSQGTIQGSSIYWNNGYYWNVDFISNPDGWVSQSQLQGGTVPPPPVGDDPIVTTPKRGLEPEEFAIVYNSADGYSQTVANNYAQARGIPSSNIIGLNFNPASYDSTSISYGDFNNYNGTGLTMRQYVLSQLNNPNIQGFILAFNQPARVNACMSVVSAFAMDFNNAHCSGDLTNNPYFESNSLTPRTTYNYMPTMALAGDSVSEATTYFNRGISADNSYPNGEVYLLTTRDNDRSQSRYSDFTTLEGIFNQSNLGTTHQVDPLYTGSGGQQIGCNSTPSYPNSYLSGVNNVLGYHTGLTCVPSLSTLTFLPGAPADHLTSYGGWLPITNPGDVQMPISDWIENGATVASGTVKEPWIVGGYTELGYKFPKASTFWKEYYTGATAVEAYQKSVRETGITNFLGEPLASPWKDPQITFSNNTLTIGITHIKPGQTWKLQSSTNGSTWSDVSGQTNITAPNGKYGLRTITVTNATAPYYRLVDTANTGIPQVQRPVNGSTSQPPGGNPSTTFSPGDSVIVTDGTN